VLAKTKMKPVDINSSRQDLTAAKTALDEILARELASTDTAVTFSAWRADRDAAISEIDRLTKLVARLESAADEDERQAEAAALAKRVNAQRQANEALARRITLTAGPAIEKLLELVRDVAIAAMVDGALNAKLPDDADKIASADMIARARAPAQRENLSEKLVSLWVFASTGSVIGNQDDVVPTGDDSTGFIRGAQHKTHAIRRKFKSITYRDAETRQPLVPFFAALRLPSPNGPGLVWDPRDGLSAAAALEALNRRPAVAERQTLTELVPVEPFVPQPASTGWGRAGDI
jgi:hypothetical protein